MNSSYNTIFNTFLLQIHCLYERQYINLGFWFSNYMDFHKIAMLKNKKVNICDGKR